MKRLSKHTGFWKVLNHFPEINSVKSSATVINFEINVGEMMKYEKSCYCVLFREMDDEHIAKYLHV